MRCFDFPGSHQFVQIAGSQFFAVFAHGLQQIHDDFQRFAAGLVVGRRASAVLMGGFHQAIHHAFGFDVVGVDVDMRGEVVVVQEGANRFVDQVDQFFFGLFQGRGEVGEVAA
jgi:hypothetical protein